MADQEQHRIPQVYWRQWAFRNHKNAEVLSVVKRGQDVSHHVLVKRFTAEKNLFDTTLHDEGFSRFFDQKCQYVETNFPKIIAALNKNSHDGQTRIFLCEFISNLFVRQQSTYDLLKWILPREYLRKKLLNEIAILEDDSEQKLVRGMYEEMSIDPEHTLDSKVSAVILQAWKHFNQVLQRFTHTLIKAPDDRAWSTSDNPVIVHGLAEDAWLIGPDAEVFFAISKEYLVYMRPKVRAKWGPLAEVADEQLSIASKELAEKIALEVLVKAKANYKILPFDQGLYNIPLDKEERYYRPLPDLEGTQAPEAFELLDTSLPPNPADPAVKTILRKLNSKADPVVVDVETVAGAEVNDCIATVDRHVERVGGERVLGWQLWMGAYLIEAEFHAVWKNPAGELKDISKKKNGVSKIVFVPDATLRYKGKQIDNVRINLTNSTAVYDLIEVCRAKFRLFNRGKRSTLYGEDFLSSLTKEQRQNVTKVELFRGMLVAFLNAGGNEDSECFCHSGKKYRNCHSLKVKELQRLK